jgi:hypothetical protein
MSAGLFVARQPGTLQALSPLRKYFEESLNYQTQLLCWKALISEEIISTETNSGRFLDINEFEKLARNDVDFVITGTSSDCREDSQIWDWAKRKGIPSFGFIEQWSFIEMRFADIVCLPDFILVVDEQVGDAVKKMNLNTPIHVVSTPVWDGLAELLPIVGKARKENLAVFLTEPSSVPGGVEEYKEINGYEDLDSLEFALQALSDWAVAQDQDWVFSIRLHPRDHRKRIEQALQEISSRKNLHRIKIDFSKLSRQEIFESAHIILGNRSIFLVEASMLGIPVVSFQPNRLNESMATDRPGIEVVTSQAQSVQALKKAVLNKARISASQNSRELMAETIQACIANRR